MTAQPPAQLPAQLPAQSPAASAAIALARQCRLAGLDVPTSATLSFARALVVLGPSRLGDLYWAGRATLVRRPDDRPIYDEVFGALLAGVSVGAEPASLPTVPLELVVEPDDERRAEVEGATGGGDRVQVRFSRAEMLRDADLALLDDDELAEVDRLLRALAVRRSRRRSRRRRADRRGHGPLDVRRTARRAVRTHGEMIERVTSRRLTTPRPLVLLVDVSGSMEPYARALLRFAHAALASGPRVEVFALGTRLSRLTRSLAGHDPDAALAAATADIADWAGGTRLGETLRRFNDEWGVAGSARGATVVILSDGWDRGQPDLLGSEMARLARVADRVVWVNPLQATEGYLPLAGGMAAALPHVDSFVSGHSLRSLEELVEVIAA